MAHQLDDVAFVTRLDPKEMLRRTNEFPKQCREALEIARQVELPEYGFQPDFFVLSGMGGSAAGGDFARALFDHQSGVPFFVNRDYHMPNWVGIRSVVFCASYSGNTEETLNSYDEAKRRGAQIIVVTSGGQLADKAREDGYPLYMIPGGHPPRTALGYMLIPVLVAAEKIGSLRDLDFDSAFALLDQCVLDWGVEMPHEKNEAKQLAEAMHGRLAVLYGLGIWQGLIANRWKGQINENSKNLAFANSFPELNHNEILGWVKAGEQGVAQWVAVVLEDGTESEKMKARAKVTAELIKDVAEVHTVRARGETMLEKLLTLTFFGDYVSIYLAALNGIDPENIDSINHLKGELAKIK